MSHLLTPSHLFEHSCWSWSIILNLLLVGHFHCKDLQLTFCSHCYHKLTFRQFCTLVQQPLSLYVMKDWDLIMSHQHLKEWRMYSCHNSSCYKHYQGMFSTVWLYQSRLFASSECDEQIRPHQEFEFEWSNDKRSLWVSLSKWDSK